MKYLKIIPILFLAIFITSCEDAVELEIDKGIEQLSVDAFINNLDTAQNIILKKSKSFFEEADQKSVTTATVNVEDDLGNNYSFTYSGDGVYTWDDSVLVHVNRAYTLTINFNGVTYTSNSFANPVPPIDSLVMFEGETGLDGKKQRFLEFHAIDRPGQEDYYWIKTFQNGVFNNKTDRLNVAIDATPGGGGDGTPFIVPVRLVFLNDADDPFESGDSARVELWSMQKEGVTFFQEIQGQTSNQGLFATPPSNVRTNIVSSSSAVENEAIGFFTSSMVSFKELLVD